ncbi:hypothetical protein ACM66B_001671 [Microbotryomycetes sp. NB124-2]
MAHVDAGQAGVVASTSDTAQTIGPTLIAAVEPRAVPGPSIAAAQSSSSSLAAMPSTSSAAATAVQKRVTRSSMGGQASTSREGSVAGTENMLPKPYLPAGTPILITVSLPSDVKPFPIKLLPADEALLNVEALRLTRQDGTPECRLLRSDDDFLSSSLGRSNVKADSSDAYYQRLHRYPEVLEKRSARLEKERLIHERNKLALELEELRGRGWVYTGAQGGKSEEDRRRRIREMEERLQRYDTLLPNQPRKSNTLNSVASDSRRRSESPAVSAKGRPRSQHDVSTKIRLSIGGSAVRGAPYRGGGKTKLPPRRRPSQFDDDEDSEDGGRHKPKGKRTDVQKSRRPSDAKRSRTSLSHWQLISVDELDESDDDDEQYSNPMAKRVRLPDSFFTNPSLRDQYLTSLKSRRQSSRLLYAFGQRLPDEVQHQEEFVPHGGTSGILAEDTAPGFSQTTLEEMIAQRGGQAFAVVNGIVVPKSAVDAYGTGPVIAVTNNMSKTMAIERATAAAYAAQSVPPPEVSPQL